MCIRDSGHSAPANTNELHRVGWREHASTDRGSELANRMAGYAGIADVDPVVERAAREDRRRNDQRLCNLGRANRVGVAGCAVLNEIDSSGIRCGFEKITSARNIEPLGQKTRCLCCLLYTSTFSQQPIHLTRMPYFLVLVIFRCSFGNKRGLHWSHIQPPLGAVPEA